MTNSNTVSMTINDTMVDTNRKIQYNTSLNADAGLIPTDNYDLTSKKYVDDKLSLLNNI